MKNNVINKDEKILIPSDIVMLSSNKKANIGQIEQFYGNNTLQQYCGGSSIGKPQHLYFLSKEEIKEGDWIYYKPNKEVYKFEKSNKSKSYDIVNSKYGNKKYFKIIASTDSSLNLPRPSNEFIKKFCKTGGIWKVLVEYVSGHNYCEICPFGIKEISEIDNKQYIGCANSSMECPNLLKVAPDNTISIYSVKNRWNREEVINLIKKYLYDHNTTDASEYEHIDIEKFTDNWIKENL